MEIGVPFSTHRRTFRKIAVISGDRQSLGCCEVSDDVGGISAHVGDELGSGPLFGCSQRDRLLLGGRAHGTGNSRVSLISAISSGP